MSLVEAHFSPEKSDVDWKILNKIDQLEQLVEASYQKPQVLFKHSTRCGISASAMYQLLHHWNFENAYLDFYYLDLIAHRNISNAITKRFNVIHQSPQIIIISKGIAVENFSHSAINSARLARSLA